MLSAKNVLQDYTMKIDGSHPVYSTERIGGRDHMPVFRSTVLALGQKFIGNPCSRRKDSEKNAASVAMKMLCKQDLSVSHKIIHIYVDLENINKFNNDVDTILSKYPGVRIFGFLSESSQLLDKKYHDAIELTMVPSSHVNAADVGMIMKVAFDITSNDDWANIPIVIYTADKFGRALLDCITNFHKLTTKRFHGKSICVSSRRTLMSTLETYTS